MEITAVKDAPRPAMQAVQLGLALATTAAALLGSAYFENVVFWVLCTVASVAAVLSLGLAARCILAIGGTRMSLLRFQQAALAVFGLALVVVGTEVYLGWRERRATHAPIVRAGAQQRSNTSRELALVERYDLPLSPEAAANVASRDGVLTMPKEWERQDVRVNRTKRSYVWHGALHVWNQDNFRRSAPFPPKKEGLFRLMVIGDSMTYGQGVDERFIYVTRLQELLGKEFNIEVLNLGACGYQSEDILEVLQTFLPQLEPDLVFYGVVHNDFLPAGQGQYTGRGFEVPIPDAWQAYLMSHARFARFLTDAYDAGLRSAGLRKDFFDDILEDFDGYQQRFGRDVVAMNAFVTGRGLPPIITMVLDQVPVYGGRGYQITKVAEEKLRNAGMDVIALEDYYRRYDGEYFRVSLWEGHADEVGHAIFASMIVPRLQSSPALQPYRKQPADAGLSAHAH